MPDLLTRMARLSAERVRAARVRESEPELRRRAADRPPAPALELDPGGFDLIAEIKRASPAAGKLAAPRGADPASLIERAAAYAAAGAAAISVLTEPEAFGGALDDLTQVACHVDCPAMRKDFLVEPYQLFEARAAGAAGALLIVRMLADTQLQEMLQAAREARLFVLLEAFDREDLHRLDKGSLAKTAPAEGLLIGLNCRDLETLRVDPARFAELRSDLPAGFPAVAESGLDSPRDAERVAASGYRAALVGTALMQAPEPAGLVAAMIAAGREETERRCPSG